MTATMPTTDRPAASPGARTAALTVVAAIALVRTAVVERRAAA